MISRKTVFLSMVSLVAVGVLLTTAVGANPLRRPIVNPVLFFQGQVSEPGTSTPKPDGNYTIAFRLYNVETGGSALWSETKSVVVVKGLFNTMLGDTTALDTSIFDGQQLWLGLEVGSDPEAVPRQPIAHAPYAIHALDANTVEGHPASDFATQNHAHTGTDITSGTVNEARLDANITRDSEVMPIFLANDGSGSGVNADFLDGLNASSFASANHTHDSRYYTKSFGNQFTGSIAAGATQSWFTFGWSPDQLVVWAVRPTTTSGKVSWDVQIERGSDGNLTYWIIVKNEGSNTTSYTGRYYRFLE